MSKLILSDAAGVAEQVEKQRKARERLVYLDTLLPSTPAPLTPEDLAIFGMFIQQDAPKFTAFARASHNDYVVFFYAEVENALEATIDEVYS